MASGANSLPPPSVASTPALAPRPPSEPPDPHPIIRALVETVSRWSPSCKRQLALLDLAGTGRADSERTLRYVSHRLRRELLIPVLSPSTDAEIRRVLHALQRMTFEDDAPDAWRNLTLGPHEPAVCGPCEPAAQRCSPACMREHRRLWCATYASGGLAANMRFGGHPREVREGVDYQGNFPLEGFLDALVVAGLPRPRVEAVLVNIVEGATRHARQNATTE